MLVVMVYAVTDRWATKLSSPVMDEWLDVSKRGSNIYRLNTNSLVSFDAEKSSTVGRGVFEVGE